MRLSRPSGDEVSAVAPWVLAALAERPALLRPADELLQLARPVLAGADPLEAALAEAYEELARLSRRARGLLGDSEIFLIENFSHLKLFTQRIAAAQVVEAAEELERSFPRRMKPSASTRGSAPTEVDDEAAYPIGGFAAVATSGSIENLVSSELAYMDEEGDLDLFDVRDVENELLFYTRDESLHVHRHRVVTFVLAASMEKARFKDPGMRWQRTIAALAVILACVAKLTRWLTEEGLLFRVAVVAGDRALETEHGLAEPM